jgi:hypothetical protein
VNFKERGWLSAIARVVKVSVRTVGVVEAVLRLSRYPEIWYGVAAQSQEKESEATAVVAYIEMEPLH